MAQKRVQVSIDEDLLDRIDAVSSARGLSRSAYFALACSKLIEAEEVSPIAKKNLADMFSLFSDVLSGARSKDEIQQDLDQLQVRNDLVKSLIE